MSVLEDLKCDHSRLSCRRNTEQTGKTRLRGSSIFDKVLYCVFCASDKDYKASSCKMKEFATLIVLPCIQDRDLFKSDRDAYRKTKIKPAVGKPMWLWH